MSYFRPIEYQVIKNKILSLKYYPSPIRHPTIYIILMEEMSKTDGRSSPQTGKWESKEFGASQGRKNHSAVTAAPEEGMEKADQAER